MTTADAYHTYTAAEHTYSFVFRTSPSDPCLIEWRRNQPGAMWLYWHRHLTPQGALDALLAIGQVGFVIEREGAL